MKQIEYFSYLNMRQIFFY